MAEESRKWMILVATIWIQAFTGTNFDFSAYSSEMKSVLGISQVQLNYLATASDLGKAVGWSSGVALKWLPLWAVMFVAAMMGLIGYGAQWLVITNVITLPYFVVFLLCFLAGCSICWFNTVCFVLCIRNFPTLRPLALSLTISFNGLSAALYNLAAISLTPPSSAIYLLLNALLPLFTSFAALLPILYQPPTDTPLSDVKRDHFTFLKLNLLALITGLYLLLLHPPTSLAASFLFSGAILLLILPLGIPGILYARDCFNHSTFRLDILVDAELHKQLLSPENSRTNGLTYTADEDPGQGCSCKSVIEKDQLAILGEEHDAQMLLRRLDFWLYYVAYLCGGTVGLVYSNNLGQIAQSLGHGLMNSKLITVYSSFSFFGRLLSAAPDFIRTKINFARTGWLAIALLPTPVAFLILCAFGGNAFVVQAGTAMIGLSSGLIFAAAVSITSELFGAESVGVNHNILITNIPIGSLVYGFLAATVYDWNAISGVGLMGNSVVCMGRKCYYLTFVLWGCVSVVGLTCSVLLFLRSRPAYLRYEQTRPRSIILDE